MKTLKCISAVFTALLMMGLCRAATIGSDTSPTRFNTQQVAGNGDRVAAFAWLAGGLRLLSSSVTATFDAVFPVLGDINLNNGTLYLSQDLYLTDASVMSGFGNIDGNAHIIDIGPSINLVPTGTASTVARCSNVGIFFDGDITLNNCVLEFGGNSSLVGRGNCLVLNPNSRINVRSDSSLLLKDIILVNVNGTGKLSGVDTTSTFSFDDTTVIMDGNFTFTQGKFDVLTNLTLTGDGKIFSYRTTQTSNILNTAQLTVDQGVTFSYAPTNASKTLLMLQGSQAVLALAGGNLDASASGIQLTKGLVNVSGNIALSGGTTGATLGDGTSANNLTLDLSPAAVLNLSGNVVFNNV